jgi:nucleotide-binding universal stress UspA family protein
VCPREVSISDEKKQNEEVKMSSIHRVLFPVDFSPACQSLLPTIRRMIEYWHAEVTLLHVIEARAWAGQRQKLEQITTRMRVIAGHLGEGSVKFRLERGVAAERVLEYVRAHQVDLVAIAARGATGARRAPLGSVADQVLAEAPCRVWLDWGWTHSNPRAGMYARRVACALANHASDEYVLRSAEDVSGNLNAALTVIQAVCEPAEHSLVLLRNQRLPDSAVAQATKRIENLRRRFLQRVDVAVEAGSHTAVVSEVIRRQASGLLVTGNLREAILGAESECPVLRVAAPGAAAGATWEASYLTAARRSA